MPKPSARKSAKRANSLPFTPKRCVSQPEEIQVELFRLAKTSMKPSAIYRDMAEKYGMDDPADGIKMHREGLSLRNVEGFVSKARSFLETAPPEVWTLLDDETGEAAMVLETLAAVVTHTQGQTRSFEVLEAEMVARIGKAFPEMSSVFRWNLAVLYAIRRELGMRTDDIDGFLAYAPWRGADHLEAYFQAVTTGWILGIPTSIFDQVPSQYRDLADTDIRQMSAFQELAVKVRSDDYASLYKGLLDEEVFGVNEAGRTLAETDSTVANDLTAEISKPVSNPVSNDARSATVQPEP